MHHRPLWQPQSLAENVQLPQRKLENRGTRNLGTLATSSVRWVGSRESYREASLSYRYPRWPGESQTSSPEPCPSHCFSGLVRLLSSVLFLPFPWAGPSALLLVPSIFPDLGGYCTVTGFPGEILESPPLFSFSAECQRTSPT